MKGPGKYDDLAEMMLLLTGGKGIFLIIEDGVLGNGTACKLSPELKERFPDILRKIATELERDNIEINKTN